MARAMRNVVTYRVLSNRGRPTGMVLCNPCLEVVMLERAVIEVSHGRHWGDCTRCGQKGMGDDEETPVPDPGADTGGNQKL